MEHQSGRLRIQDWQGQTGLSEGEMMGHNVGL